MVKISFYICISFFFLTGTLFGQDTIKDGDISSIEAFRIDLNTRFEFGKTYNQLNDENIETFVKRIISDKGTLHHGAFKLDKFKNNIISFVSYMFQETPIVIGIMLKPTDLKHEYKLIKTLEISSGCGNSLEVKSVFLHNIGVNSKEKSLLIHTSDYCGKHGTYNDVFIYNGTVLNNKLVLKNHLSEHCDYSEVKIDGNWDLDMGDEDVEERKYNKCDYSNFKAIKNKINSSKY